MRNIYEIKYLRYSATKYRIHNGISFFIVLKGHAMVTIRENSYDYNEGELFILKHNECYKLDVSEGNVVVQIHFYESLIDNMMPGLLSSEFRLKGQSDVMPLRDALAQMCFIYLNKQVDKNINIMKKMIYILESFDEFIEIDLNQNIYHHQQIHPMIEEIRNYIYYHYNERITMNTFTKKYHLSDSYFSKMFKEQMGMNFKDYLTGIRLLNSIYDLIHTHEKIIDISEKHGFNNDSSYITCFKLYYGVTPKKYRDMFQIESKRFAKQNFYNEVDYERNLSRDEMRTQLRSFEEKYLKAECV